MKRYLLFCALLFSCGVESPDTKAPEPEIQIPLSGSGQAVIVNNSGSVPSSTTPVQNSAESQPDLATSPPDSIIREYIENDCIPGLKDVLEQQGYENVEVWAVYPFKEIPNTNPGKIWKYEIELRDNVDYTRKVFDATPTDPKRERFVFCYPTAYAKSENLGGGFTVVGHSQISYVPVEK